MITLTEKPDISSWSMKSIGPLFITTNKASGGDGIPVETFQILEDDAVKMLHSLSFPNYASKIGKLGSGHRTGKGQFSFQSQKKAMAKTV